MTTRSNDLDKGKPTVRWGRKARGLSLKRRFRSSDSPAAERSVLQMAIALLELAVPILSGSIYLPHSPAQVVSGVDVPQTSVGDEKEVSA